MADVVGSYAVSTFTTPTQGAQASSSVLRGNFNTLRDAITNHDADAQLHWQSSTYAGLPAAGTASKAKYLTTDTRRIYVDLTNAGALSEVAYVPYASGVADVTTAYSIGAVERLSTTANYTSLKSPAAAIGVSVGTAATGNTNAYDADTHSFRSRDTTVTRAQLDASAVAGNTALLLWDVTAAALVRVTRGASDSGGAGYRVLRIPN